MTFASETEFEEMRKIVNKLKEKIEKIMKINRELAETLIIIANLQEKIINILQDIRKEVKLHSTILEKHTRILEEHLRKLDEHSRKLEDHSKMLQTLIKDVRDIKVMIKRFAGDIENEARESVPYYLREITGKKIKLERIEVKGTTEVDLYGVTNDICIIGEVKTRIGLSAILDVCSSLINLYEKTPAMLRNKIIFIIYGLEITKLAEDCAKEYGIGIVTPRGILIKPKILNLPAALEICKKIRKTFIVAKS